MKNLLKKIIIVYTILSIPLQMFSQLNTNQLIREIRNEMETVRKGGVLSNEYSFNSETEKTCLDFVNSYKNDSNTQVQLHALIIKFKIGVSSLNYLIRQSIVFDFTKCISNEDETLSKFSLTALASFDKIDYTVSSKNNIIINFEKLKSSKEYLFICGAVEIKELKNNLKKIALEFNRKKQNWYIENSWFASLALLRMNDTTNIDNIITAVELELNPVLRVTRLLKDISYSRNSDAIKLLQKYLESNEFLESSRGGLNGVGFNQYALEYLANNIRNFPIKPKGLGYTKEDIQIAITFLRKE